MTVLDLRPEDEFALGHVPGAINVPLGELEKRLAEFDPDQEIVAYCRGPYCVLSYEAVAMLRARGFNVRRLEDGLPEWRASRDAGCGRLRREIAPLNASIALVTWSRTNAMLAADHPPVTRLPQAVTSLVRRGPVA